MNNYFNFNRFVAYNRMWFETNEMKKKYFYLLLWLVGVSCFFVITFLNKLPEDHGVLVIESVLSNGYIQILMCVYCVFCIRLCTIPRITMLCDNCSYLSFLVPASVVERVLTLMFQVQLLSLLVFYALTFVTLNLSAYIITNYVSQPAELYDPWTFICYSNVSSTNIVSLPVIWFCLPLTVCFVNLLNNLQMVGRRVLGAIIAFFIFITYPKIVFLWDYKQLIEMPQWVQSLYFIAPIVFWAMVPFLMKRQEAIASK